MVLSASCIANSLRSEYLPGQVAQCEERRILATTWSTHGALTVGIRRVLVELHDVLRGPRVLLRFEPVVTVIVREHLRRRKCVVRVVEPGST